MTGKTILLVEDNPKVMRNNKNLLISKGAKVLTASNLAKAREHLHTAQIDAAVLDITLPDGSGISLLKEIRSGEKTARLPVLLLTAKGEPDDVVDGFNCGADDYLSKPYELKVLLVRLEALLRRTSLHTIHNNVDFGSLRFDVVTNQAFCKDKDLSLTQKEFALLLILAQNEGKMVSSQYLHKKVWGAAERPMSREENSALRVHISNLKKKLAEFTADILIEASRNEGYSLQKP
jgi:DNA-binding response OmpR family regulator